MSDQFLGEIRMFAGNFAPAGWATCDGQLLALQQFSALFSLLGTQFGGDGERTFNLPDLRARFPLNYGNGAGLSQYNIGESGGESNVTVTAAEMPAHSHIASVSSDQASSRDPQNNYLAVSDHYVYSSAKPSALVSLSQYTVSGSGGNIPHNNVQPYLVVTFIVALSGIFPSRG